MKFFIKGIQNMLDIGAIDDSEDLDGDGEPDHLVETRNKIDDYLAKQVGFYLECVETYLHVSVAARQA